MTLILQIRDIILILEKSMPYLYSPLAEMLDRYSKPAHILITSARASLSAI